MKKQLLLLVMMLLPMAVWADPVEIDGIYYNLISKIKEAEVTHGNYLDGGDDPQLQTVGTGTCLVLTYNN